MIGVPFPELEADDTGIELNKGGFCAEEHPQSPQTVEMN